MNLLINRSPYQSISLSNDLLINLLINQSLYQTISLSIDLLFNKSFYPTISLSVNLPISRSPYQLSTLSNNLLINRYPYQPISLSNDLSISRSPYQGDLFINWLKQDISHLLSLLGSSLCDHFRLPSLLAFHLFRHNSSSRIFLQIKKIENQQMFNFIALQKVKLNFKKSLNI